MRTTLRSGKSDKTSTTIHKSRSSGPTKKPGASMAATLAWTGRDSRESKVKSRSQNKTPLQARTPDQRRSGEIPRVKATTERNQWDSHSRRLVAAHESATSTSASASRSSPEPVRDSGEFSHTTSSTLALGAASNALNNMNLQDRHDSGSNLREEIDALSKRGAAAAHDKPSASRGGSHVPGSNSESTVNRVKRKPATRSSGLEPNSTRKRDAKHRTGRDQRDTLESTDEDLGVSQTPRRRPKDQQPRSHGSSEDEGASTQTSEDEETRKAKMEWQKRKKAVLRSLPPGVDEAAAQAIFNEIVVQGDEVHWNDVAGL
ncbi:hypothetical protein Micbo1qcDRAFT_164302, partial [Microdochium bolleyi]